MDVLCRQMDVTACGLFLLFFFFQAEDGIRDYCVTGVQTCALPISRALAAEAARHGVRTLAHADGGGVLYLDAAADPAMAARTITGSLDRLGVCNRLNLLLVHETAWNALLPVALEALEACGVAASLPPHGHRLGHEWAL